MLCSGTLAKLEIAQEQPAAFALRVGGVEVPLNPLIGHGIQVRPLGGVTCGNCGAASAKSFGRGYCYECFTTLARCDLCVVSPDRCHFHLGTCREPEWGESFCMQPHVVYLANASGLKVGITRKHRAVGRWLDQGAVQGLVIAETLTRRDAGLAEARLAQRISDRTDWRKLVSADAPPIDLAGWAARLRHLLGEDVAYVGDVEAITELRYPVTRYPPVERLNLTEGGFCSRLIGCKGSYLLFEHGVFNAAEHVGFEVAFELVDNPPAPPADEQLALF